MTLSQEFLDNVKNHKMTVLLDNGVYRHLRFRAPETSNRYFEIVTYPGYLMISGDMGTYVFQRLNDMFEFFRHDGINLDYWSEKVDAEDKNTKVREFSPEYAEKIILDHINEYFEEDDEDKKRVLEEFKNFNFENEYELRSDLSKSDESCFQDSWEWSFKEYTYYFVWCCQAIVWAIKQWDDFKFGNGRGDGDSRHYNADSDRSGHSVHSSAFSGYGLEDGDGVGGGNGNKTPGLQE